MVPSEDYEELYGTAVGPRGPVGVPILWAAAEFVDSAVGLGFLGMYAADEEAGGVDVDGHLRS